ncbi:pentapeptide repeat-containing protein [Cytophagaceae bacterium ABcell3]|nr:pentapeptide repeat-containing protein [Cytophagaceae bacterium ABcell3]
MKNGNGVNKAVKVRQIFAKRPKKFYEVQSNTASRILADPILTTSLIFIALSVLVFLLTFPYFQDDPVEYFKSILIEAHGMLFDVGVIGILLYWLNKKGEKKIRVQHYQDEIDDIRLWKSEEAGFKILGNIKRLLRENVRKLDLHQCYLRNVKLSFADLHESNFNNADLANSVLNETIFSGSRMNYINLEGSSLNKSNLESCYLNAANLSSVRGIKTIFKNSLLIKANFDSAFFVEADFSGCDMSGANFDNVSFYRTDFTNASGLTADQFKKVKHLNKPIMDKGLYAQVLEKFPHLLTKAYKA